jgi:hypothetical protein
MPIFNSTWGAGLPTQTPPKWLPGWFLGSWSFGLLRAMNVRDEQASVIPVEKKALIIFLTAGALLYTILRKRSIPSFTKWLTS